MIAAVFMHLRQESGRLVLVAATPLALGVILFVALLA